MNKKSEKIRFIKLIGSYEILTRIDHNKKNITKEDLTNIILKPNIEELYNCVSNDIILTKFKKPHIYKFQLIVHAQEQK